jgi:polyhydroxyalkanoate synthesis repressor PhaR
MTSGPVTGGSGGATPPGSSSSSSKPTKVIKRYANRKLYDTERSCYVTLEEISQMIKEGEDVKVVDNKTKDDLTAVTLAQIIVEEEKKVQKMPLKLLRSIIQSGNDAIGDFYEKRVADPVKSIKDDVESRVASLFKKDGTKADGDPTASQPPSAADAKEAGVVKELVHSTTEAFESWQKRIDERVREAMSKMTPHRPDIDALKARVEELEARIREVEAKKKA